MYIELTGSFASFHLDRVLHYGYGRWPLKMSLGTTSRWLTRLLMIVDNCFTNRGVVPGRLTPGNGIAGEGRVCIDYCEDEEK